MIRDAASAEEEGHDASSDKDDSVYDDANARAVTVRNGIISQPDEGTALLRSKAALDSHKHHHYDTIRDVESQSYDYRTTLDRFRALISRSRTRSVSIVRTIISPKSWEARAIWKQGVVRPAGFVPAIILGLLLNILDALSYGMMEHQNMKKLRC